MRVRGPLGKRQREIDIPTPWVPPLSTPGDAGASVFPSRTWGMSSSPTSRANFSPALVPHTLISSRPSCGKARVSSAYQWSILVRSHCAPLKQACSTESLCRSWVGMTAGPVYPRPLTAMRVNLLFFLHCPLGTELLTKSLERSGQKFPEREKTKITTGMMTGGAQGIAL